MFAFVDVAHHQTEQGQFVVPAFSDDDGASRLREAVQHGKLDGPRIVLIQVKRDASTRQLEGKEVECIRYEARSRGRSSPDSLTF